MSRNIPFQTSVKALLRELYPFSYLSALSIPFNTCVVMEIINKLKLIPVMAASFKKPVMSPEETVLELKKLLKSKSMPCEGLFMGLRGIPVPIFTT